MPSEQRRLAFWLLAACVVAITHGSIYPWQFGPTHGYAHSWSGMFFAGRLWSSTGDVIANVVLFVPLGALIGCLLPAGARRRGAFWLALGAALLFAFGLQVLQIWMPRRSPAISDVVWNGVGLLAGLPLARAVPGLLHGALHLRRAPYRMGVAMAVAWLAVTWWPLLPALSRRNVYSALHQLRELASSAPQAWWDAWGPALGVVLVLHLLRPAAWRAAAALALPPLALLGQFVFSFQPDWSVDVLGWLLGAALGALSWRLPERLVARGLLVLVLVRLWWVAVLPWDWSAQPQPFNWVPLAAALNDERVWRTALLVRDAFWLAAALLLTLREGLPLRWGAAGLTVMMLALEWLQRWMPEQSPSITPVLLPALAMMALRLLDADDRRLHHREDQREPSQP
jgi:hypothetical protein